ncbi:MAG: hypothetical protein FIA89_11110 [Geobacter sp.]|nr:hypothetical protein [Geobacter sp.]
MPTDTNTTPVRPEGIAYWLHERPPLSMTIMAALQQLAFLGAIMTLPVLLAHQAGLNDAGAAGLVSLTMVGAGCGVILQALNRSGVGIGLFSPMHTSAVAFPASLAAVKMGGLDLAFGMMTVAASVQLAVSRVLPRLRPFFPVEIAGLIVLILGLGLGLIGLRAFLAVDTPFEGDIRTFQTGFLTLAVIIGCNIWGRGRLHAFAVFIGLVTGQLFALLNGVVNRSLVDDIFQVPFFAVPPIAQFGWEFRWSLVPEFIIVGLALSFNCFGVLTVAQRANDAAWKRPDIPGISRGLLAEGLTNAFCALINGVAQTASGGAIGLAQASGVTSRIVAFVLGGLFIALAFFPPFAAFWISLSPPVIGAVLMFVASFIIVGGIKIITSRLLDTRKIVTIGLSLIMAIGHDAVLTAHFGRPEGTVLSPLANTVTVALLVAIALNALFQLKVHKTVTRTLQLNEQWQQTTSELIWHLGHQWGARPEVIRRLDHGLHELLDALYAYNLSTAPEIGLQATFDEYRCRMQVCYQGQALLIPASRPDPDELLHTPDGFQTLAGFLISRLADEVRVETRNNSCIVTMTFHD